jgi:hypothetical protein
MTASVDLPLDTSTDQADPGLHSAPGSTVTGSPVTGSAVSGFAGCSAVSGPDHLQVAWTASRPAVPGSPAETAVRARLTELRRAQYGLCPAGHLRCVRVTGIGRTALTSLYCPTCPSRG